MQALNKCRGQAVRRFRDVMPSLLGLDPTKLYINYDRSKLPEIQSLLKENPDSPNYLMFPPILYPPGQKHRKNIFMNPILPQVAKNSSVFHAADIFSVTSSMVVWCIVTSRRKDSLTQDIWPEMGGQCCDSWGNCIHGYFGKHYQIAGIVAHRDNRPFSFFRPMKSLTQKAQGQTLITRKTSMATRKSLSERLTADASKHYLNTTTTSYLRSGQTRKVPKIWRAIFEISMRLWMPSR